MGKAILLSIRPNWVKLILNKKKIYEIRKQFPKDYVGWVYIYCTKGNGKERLYPVALLDKSNQVFKRAYREDDIDNRTNYLNGKVVARFWCDKVLELRPFSYGGHTWWIEKTTTNYKQFLQILQRSLLTEKQIKDYAKRKRELFAVVVDKLEIFDKPKELNEFGKCELLGCCDYQKCNKCRHHIKLTKAAQNFMYIDIE